MDPHTGCYIFFKRMIKIKKVICLIKTCLPLRQRNKKNLNLRKIGILVFYVLISEEHRGSNILRVLDPGSGNIEIKNRIRIHPQGLFDLQIVQTLFFLIRTKVQHSVISLLLGYEPPPPPPLCTIWCGYIPGLRKLLQHPPTPLQQPHQLAPGHELHYYKKN